MANGEPLKQPAAALPANRVIRRERKQPDRRRSLSKTLLRYLKGTASFLGLG
jgi:hypothetical protein